MKLAKKKTQRALFFYEIGNNEIKIDGGFVQSVSVYIVAVVDKYMKTTPLA